MNHPRLNLDTDNFWTSETADCTTLQVTISIFENVPFLPSPSGGNFIWINNSKPSGNPTRKPNSLCGWGAPIDNYTKSGANIFLHTLHMLLELLQNNYFFSFLHIWQLYEKLMSLFGSLMLFIYNIYSFIFTIMYNTMVDDFSHILQSTSFLAVLYHTWFPITLFI